ncbi:hypothetical protein DN824_21910 [Stutzerimonas nosocomialis]|uniref:hypothetical protein n=1 Tax=Stutzerimonas nosocomialis TaxID=1056496 RepID=UPI00110831EF|nr:hypothetical protein [Stutzerimonas nosocomialis]TLX52767.1 hypothetical protein DN824_21910 [Stutzerimonas nosocomialis]
MLNTDKARAEFDAWWDRQPHHEQFEDVKTQMFNVWAASRRKLVIELPPRHPAFGQGRSWNKCLDTCREAIEAAGVPVKE